MPQRDFNPGDHIWSRGGPHVQFNSAGTVEARVTYGTVLVAWDGCAPILRSWEEPRDLGRIIEVPHD